ncbi:MAG: outer membrane protein assembly factor BamB [Candidatus Latescibacterota bacterium]|jgi:outer membrane protein assembly factor BamB
MRTVFSLVFCCLWVVGGQNVFASDWTHWRGPGQSGASPETGLVSHWSLEGENLLWRSDFIGRSTPVIVGGKVYVIGRTGQGITEQEHVACFDAKSGALLWEKKFNVWHSTIPFNRLGWASLGADGETGNVYAHLVSGLFVCFDGDGHIQWVRSLGEEFNRFSGYGGRLHTPVVDGDLVMVSMGNRGWAAQPPSHRYMAFNKRTGETVWMSRPGGGNQVDLTVYSTPVATTINGTRAFVAGNGNGGVFAFKAATGEAIWGFPFSGRGLNTSPVVAGNRVYATHSEENVGSTALGSVICLDATTGKQIWRQDGMTVGYASPAVHGGRVYVMDNSANVHCLDGETGKEYWEHNVGTVGKGSPTWADGKLYVTDVNGGFQILKVSDAGAEVLDKKQITMPDGVHAEIYSSVAVAYGRVYLVTEAGLFCLGDKDAPFKVTPSPFVKHEMAPAGATPATILSVPAEATLSPGEVLPLRVLAYDDKGRLIGPVDAAWSLTGLAGKVEGGQFESSKIGQGGWVTAKVGALTGQTWVRVVPDVPWTEDFENVAMGKNPTHWVWGGRGFKVEDKEGNKVLAKPPAAKGLDRANLYVGPPEMKGYTIQTDLMGTKNRRRLPDLGLVANRYLLDMQGIHQRLEVRSWSSDLRMRKYIDFKWDVDVWYTMKMKVDIEDGKAIIRGKVWKRDEAEPEAWTIEVEDPLPVHEGSPGLYGYSPATIYFDNVKVW